MRVALVVVAPVTVSFYVASFADAVAADFAAPLVFVVVDVVDSSVVADSFVAVAE